MKAADLGIVGARAVAFALTTLGQSKLASAINALADAVQAGVNIDAKMQEVADRLKNGPPFTDDEVDALVVEINAKSAELQGIDPNR